MQGSNRGSVLVLYLALSLSLAGGAVIPLAVNAAETSDAAADLGSGRAGFWRKGTQGSPSLKQAEKKVTQNPKDAVANNDLGWAYRQCGDLDKAIKYLQEAIRLKEDLAQAHSNLSVAYFDKKQTAEALTEARRAVALDPKNAVYLLVLGNALDQNGDTNDAIESYKAALKLRPDYENALYHLGRILTAQGNKSEASLILAEALKLDPEDERVMQLLDPMVADGAASTSTADGAKKKGKSASSTKKDQ